MTSPLLIKQYWNQVITSFRQNIEEKLIDSSNTDILNKVNSTIGNTDDFYENYPLRIAIVSSFVLDEEKQNQIAQWLGIDARYISTKEIIINVLKPNSKKQLKLLYNFYLLESLPKNSLGDIGTSILVLICHSNMNDEKAFEKLVGFTVHSKVALLIDPSENSQLSELLASMDWYERKLNSDELLSEKFVDSFINENLVILLKNLAILHILNDLVQLLIHQLKSKLELRKVQLIRLQSMLIENKRKFNFEEIVNLHKETYSKLDNTLKQQNTILDYQLTPLWSGVEKSERIYQM